MKNRPVLVTVLVLWASALGLAYAPAPASGTTFTVLTTADNTTSDASCSLREAILAANGAPANGDCGADHGAPYVIDFNIGGGGRQSIAPSAAFPAIARSLTLSGTTQPGCAAYPCIELNGAGAGAGVDGLDVTAGGSTIAGLVINRFAHHGILLTNNNSNTIIGNYIGVDITGTQALANGGDGIAICCGSYNNIIGGVANAARNVIAGNDQHGVQILYGSSDNWVMHNLIGTTLGANAHLGNHYDGVSVASFGVPAPANNIIGQKLDGEGVGNIIAYNNGNGVTIGANHNDTTSGNAILGNNIFANGCLGIDLSDSVSGCSSGVSVTPNHANCSLTGPNQFQNYPVLQGAIYGAGFTEVAGTLNCKPNTTYRLEFFANGVADGSGFGEGSRYLGGALTNTDGAGNVTFSIQIASVTTVGLQLSATATDPSGNTSEFARDVLVGAGNVLQLPLVLR